MADPFYGEIRIFGFKYPPQDWAFCAGQQIAIRQNPGLYSLLGTTYGGDGKDTFNLPNMLGYAPMGAADLARTSLGLKTGTDSVPLSTAHNPPHDHSVTVISPPIKAHEQSNPATNTSPIGAINYQTQVASRIYKGVAQDVSLHPATLVSYGHGMAHENRQPFLALNFCISLLGVYPPFN
jgi:microcystin-dependent protein